MRSVLNDALSQYKLACSQVRESKQELIEQDEKLYDTERGQQIIQSVAQSIQQEVHKRIAVVVSECLEAVFDEPYTFDIEFEKKRGKTEARLSFVRDGMRVDPLSASGGGVVDVASFALRLSCLLLRRPPVRRLLVLDEPWKHLSSEYRPRMRELIETLSEEMGMQFIIVTHSSEFKIGKVIEL